MLHNWLERFVQALYRITVDYHENRSSYNQVRGYWKSEISR